MKAHTGQQRNFYAVFSYGSRSRGVKYHSLARGKAVARGFQDPHKVLNVEPGASRQSVKKAYKKLALRFHPDVSKEELAESKFRGLKEAYELLMGKGNPDKQKQAPFGGSWDFHDWYWTFSMRQRQRRQNSSAAAHHSAAAAQAHKSSVMSQLTGLKARAAQRKARPATSSDAFVTDDASGSATEPVHSDQNVRVEAPAHSTHTPSPTSPQPQPNPTPSPQASPSSWNSHPMPQTATQHAVQDEEEPSDDPSKSLWETLTAQLLRHYAVEAALQRHHECVEGYKQHLQQWVVSGWGAAEKVGGQELQTEVPPSVRFQHSATARAPSHGVPRGAGDVGDGGEERQSAGVSVLEREAGAEREARGSGGEEGGAGELHEGKEYSRRQRFTATEERRSAVNSQLAGLRRKAQMCRQD